MVSTGPAVLGAFGAVVLAGGRGSRLGGVDKAGIEVDGRTLLARTLEALADAAEVVVVGEQVPTDRPVTFVLEDPRHGGPVAGLLTGRDALLRATPHLVVLAVDMPRVTMATVRRLLDGAQDAGAQDTGAQDTGGSDGAVLVGPDGRRQLAVALDLTRLDAVRPGREEQHGMALRRLLDPLDLLEVPALGEEHRDVDTWADLRDLADPAAG